MEFTLTGSLVERFAAALLIGALVGLERLDAITLSVGRLVGIEIPAEMGARVLLLAVASNTIVKGTIVRMAGSLSLFKKLLPFFLVQVLIALAFVVMWS